MLNFVSDAADRVEGLPIDFHVQRFETLLERMEIDRLLSIALKNHDTVLQDG